MELIILIAFLVIVSRIIGKALYNRTKDKQYNYASHGQAIQSHKGLHISKRLKQRSFDSVHNPNWERKKKRWRNR